MAQKIKNSIHQNIKGLRILTSKVNPDKIYKEANRRLNVKEYEELVTKEKRIPNARFVTKETNDVITNSLLVGGKDEFDDEFCR